MYARARNTNTRTHTHTHTHAHAHVARAHTWKPPMYITPKVAKSALRRRSSVSRFSTTSCAMPSAIHVCTPAVDTAVATGRARAAALYALPTAIAGARRTCHARFAASIPSAPGRRTCHSPARLCLPARPDARAHKSRPTPYSIPAGHATSSPTERVWRADRPSGGKCVCVCALIARTPALQETRRVHAAVPARRRHGCSPFERSLALACMSGVTHRGREEAREGDGSGPPHTTPQAPLRPRGRPAGVNSDRLTFLSL